MTEPAGLIFNVWSSASSELSIARADQVQSIVSLPASSLSPTGNFPRLSPDRRWLALVTDKNELELQAVDQTLTYTVSGGEDISIGQGVFSRDSNRFAYLVLGAPGASGADWFVGIVEAGSGKSALFKGAYSFKDPKASIRPGFPLGWGPDPHHLLLNTFFPFSEGIDQGIVSLDDSSAVTGMTLPVPALKPVLPAGYHSPALSPDDTHLAYLSLTPGYQPANYQVRGMAGFAYNQVNVLDLQSGKSSSLFTVTDGRALIPSVAWSPSGDAVVVGIGSYHNNDTLTAASLQDVGLDGGLRGTEIPLPQTSSPYSLAWCSPNGAHVVATENGQAPHKLWFIPFAGAPAATLASSANPIALQDCVEE